MATELEPIVELACEDRSLNLNPLIWKQFSYLKMIVSSSSASKYDIVLDESFMPFFRFMKQEPIKTYVDLLSLREQLLVFGLCPKSSIATRATLHISEVIHSFHSCATFWDVIQIGWNGIVEEEPQGFCDTFFRQTRIRGLLSTALLPLDGYTIDILNTETLKELKHMSLDTTTEKQVHLRNIVESLFDKSCCLTNSLFVIPSSN